MIYIYVECTVGLAQYPIVHILKNMCTYVLQTVILLHLSYTWWRHQMKHFRVTGPVFGEFTSHRWIPITKASDTELWCFLWSASEQTVVQIIETPVIWEVLIMTSMYCTLWDLWDRSIERRSCYYLHAISTLWHYIDDNLNIVSSSLMCICAIMISLCFNGEKWQKMEIYFMFHKQYASTRLCFRSAQITQTWWALYEKKKSKRTFYLID